MPKRPAPKLNAAELWEYALSTLSRRAVSTSELRQRLAKRALDTADIPDILHRLQDSRYLDDSRFAESFAQSRLDSQGHGRHRVLRDLRSRRVSAPLAEQIVKTVYDATDEVALIEDYLARKYRNRSLPALLQEPLQLASAYRKLRYAGFSSAQSIRVLKRYSAQAAELESMEDEEL